MLFSEGGNNMKTKKMVKILVMFLMIITVLMSTASVFATDGDAITMTPDSIKAQKTEADEKIQLYGGKILSAVTTAGIVLSVVVLAVIGVKYMLGSAEEKAEYKKTLMPYIIGAALVFGASTIATIVFQFFME